MRLELTRRGSYAIRAVIALARAEGPAVVPASRIARDMHIPARFLPQVLADLVHSGIVEARLGRRGGYRLRKAAASVTLLDIIEATEGDTRRRTCVLTGASCGNMEQPCEVHGVFMAAQNDMLSNLSAATIADVAGREGAGSAP